MSDKEIVVRLAFFQILHLGSYSVELLATSEMLRIAKKIVSEYGDGAALNKENQQTLLDLNAWIREAEKV